MISGAEQVKTGLRRKLVNAVLSVLNMRRKVGNRPTVGGHADQGDGLGGCLGSKSLCKVFTMDAVLVFIAVRITLANAA